MRLCSRWCCFPLPPPTQTTTRMNTTAHSERLLFLPTWFFVAFFPHPPTLSPLWGLQFELQPSKRSGCAAVRHGRKRKVHFGYARFASGQRWRSHPHGQLQLRCLAPGSDGNHLLNANRHMSRDAYRGTGGRPHHRAAPAARGRRTVFHRRTCGTSGYTACRASSRPPRSAPTEPPSRVIAALTIFRPG